MFICRGTDRYQIPLSAPVSKDAPWCYTLCAHRVTGEIHDLGLREWHSLTRAQRIAKNLPSRLTLTIFGRKITAKPDDAGKEIDHHAVESNSQVRAVEQSQSMPKSTEMCEGWAPPPTPLHGPCFRALESDEKSHLV